MESIEAMRGFGQLGERTEVHRNDDRDCGGATVVMPSWWMRSPAGVFCCREQPPPVSLSPAGD